MREDFCLRACLFEKNHSLGSYILLILNWFLALRNMLAIKQFSQRAINLTTFQGGFIHSIIMFTLSFFIVMMTILSVCAISTNGAIEGGGENDTYCFLENIPNYLV